MSKTDGGPAFPHTLGMVVGEKTGMTLRDYFAAAALSLGEGVWEGKGEDGFGEMARTCYRIADAMLAERDK